LDLSINVYISSLRNKIGRLNVSSLILFRPFGSDYLKNGGIRIKCFGAKIEWSSHIYASVKIWAPWNLEIGTNSGPKVDCYNQGKISLVRIR
jgi:putative colanic acid biosynthesis acetyltransferase WcaF